MEFIDPFVIRARTDSGWLHAVIAISYAVHVRLRDSGKMHVKTAVHEAVGPWERIAL